MKHTIIDKAALKAKSEELGIPFSNLLAGHVLEEFMYLVTDSAFAEYLWLKDGDIFGLDHYREKNHLTLDFVYITDDWIIKRGEARPGQKLSLKMGYVLLASLLDEKKVPEIKWRGRVSSLENVVELEISGEFAGMTVPLHINITELQQQEMVPKKKELDLFMEKNLKITYLEYPAESVLAEKFFLIIKDMELLTDLSAYDTAYHILDNEAVNGRHVKVLLEEHCREQQIMSEQERVQTIVKYRDYTYMRKRWEKYLRHRKRKAPSWEEVMTLVEAFLPRVWTSICEDEVFFGDWMPGLRRFLD